MHFNKKKTLRQKLDERKSSWWKMKEKGMQNHTKNAVIVLNTLWQNSSKAYKTYEVKHKKDFQSTSLEEGIHSLLHQTIMARRHLN